MFLTALFTWAVSSCLQEPQVSFLFSASHKNLIRLNKSKCRVLYLVRAIPGMSTDWEQPWGEGLGGSGGWKAGFDLAMHAQSPECCLCAGLLLKKPGWWVKRSDPATSLLINSVSSPGILRTGKSSSCWNELLWMCPLKGAQAERDGVFYPGEEKAEGSRLYSAFQYLPGFKEKRESSCLLSLCSDRARGNGFKLKDEVFRWDTRREFFNVRIVRHQCRLPREGLDGPRGWKGSRPGEMGLWATWPSGWHLCPWEVN